MKVIKSLRAPVLVTLVLLLICGLIYPVVMTLMSQALFPSQANGSIIYVDGQAVGAKNVGQDFTDPRFMRCRPSAYQYNTYTVDEEGNKFYNDGSEYAGVASGSNNYGASKPRSGGARAGRHRRIPGGASRPDGGGHPHRPGDGLRFRPGIPTSALPLRLCRFRSWRRTRDLTEEQLEQFVADNTTGKVLGIFGEETVNVLGVNLDIAEALGLIGGVD